MRATTWPLWPHACTPSSSHRSNPVLCTSHSPSRILCLCCTLRISRTSHNSTSLHIPYPSCNTRSLLSNPSSLTLSLPTLSWILPSSYPVQHLLPPRHHRHIEQPEDASWISSSYSICSTGKLRFVNKIIRLHRVTCKAVSMRWSDPTRQTGVENHVRAAGQGPPWKNRQTVETAPGDRFSCVAFFPHMVKNVLSI